MYYLKYGWVFDSVKILDRVILLYISYDINYFYYYILYMGQVLPKSG